MYVGKFFFEKTGTKYIGLLNDLDNDYAKVENRYTISVQDQWQMMEFWKQSYVPKKGFSSTKKNS